MEEIFFVCNALKLHVITINKSVHAYFVKNGISSTIISKKPTQFKTEFTNIRPSAVLLDNDHLSGRGQWVAKKYPSYLICDLNIISEDKYIKRKDAGFVGSRLWKVLHRIAGITCQLYEAEIDMHDCSIKTFFRIIRDRILLGYKSTKALPGWYCDKVIVQNSESEKIYIENNFPKDRLFNIGSPYEDYYLELCNSTKVIAPDIDVLFFSQPIYLGKFDSWMDEVSDLVNDCYSNSLKLVIKLHPRDIIEKYEPFKDRCEIVISDGASHTIVNLIQRARLIVVKSSTVIIQSLLCKKPIAYINYRNVIPFTNMKKTFLKRMVLTPKNNIQLINDTISLDYDFIMKHQTEMLGKIARFDNGSISRLSEILAEDS